MFSIGACSFSYIIVLYAFVRYNMFIEILYLSKDMI